MTTEPFDRTRPLPERVAAMIEWQRESGDEDVTRLIEDLAAALPVWRPIATAPRGTQVLIWTPSDGLALGTLVDRQWVTEGAVWTVPTHWQPLPAGPQQETT